LSAGPDPRAVHSWPEDLVTLLLLVALMAPMNQATRAPAAPVQDSASVYRTLLLRAAPGRLQELIDAWKARLGAYETAGEERPLILRHTQGDHWDLMLLFPIGSLADYFGGARAARWLRAAPRGAPSEAAFEQRLEPLIAWREEVFVQGPPLSVLRARDAGAGFYHAEMFVALAGKRDALLEERRMENRYAEASGRPTTLIFSRLAGASWDSFTLGFYRDLQHYAEPSALSDEAIDAAARAAGFTGRNAIGVYMRSLIHSHHDTLLTRVH
jgi:hypothetical protein